MSASRCRGVLAHSEHRSACAASSRVVIWKVRIICISAAIVPPPSPRRPDPPKQKRGLGMFETHIDIGVVRLDYCDKFSTGKYCCRLR